MLCASSGTAQPWQRAFTYGDVPKAQWLAEIYVDVDLLATDYGRVDGFRRILVGAPLWIRTPDLRAIRLYATSDDPDVVSDRQIQAKPGGTKADKIASQAGLDRGKDASRATTVEVQADDEPRRKTCRSRLSLSHTRCTERSRLALSWSGRLGNP
jgi:hypothetical protein